MNTAQVSFTKKEIFRMRYVALFLGQYICLLAIIFCIIECNRTKLETLLSASFSPASFISVQVTISFLSITVMQLLLPDSKREVMGLTFQNIYFKWDIIKCFNFINCFLYMFLLMTSYIIMAILCVCLESNNVQTICKLGALLSLMESLPLAFYMVYLGLTAKYKNSRIYYLIYKKIKSEIFPGQLLKFLAKCQICNKRDEYVVCNKIIESKNYTKGDRNTCVHNIYIKEEFFIIAFLFLNVKKIKLRNIDENQARAILYGKFNTMLREEYAYDKAVFTTMRLWGEKQFGEAIDELFAFCLEKGFLSQMV